MATQYHKFTGRVKWAKVYKPDDKYQKYSVDFYFKDKELERFKKLGLELKIREDEDGTYVRFSRPHAKLIKNEIVTLGPPKVFTWVDKTQEPFDAIIGNGSVCTVDIAVYDTIKGKGHTLQSVAIVDHVAYERPEQD